MLCWCLVVFIVDFVDLFFVVGILLSCYCGGLFGNFIGDLFKYELCIFLNVGWYLYEWVFELVFYW